MEEPIVEFPEADILQACSEVELHQREMIPVLAAALNVPVEAVFYTWAFRQCSQHGELPGTPWRYFFHGFECDLMNTADGRFLRLDFGPHGRTDTISAWGVLQFIMTATAPWTGFLALQRLFADKEPPYNQFSGNFHKFCEYWDRLEGQDCFDVADSTLVEFLAHCTTVDSQGIQAVHFPPGTAEKTQIDCSVAHRKILSANARQLLEARRTQTMRM
jgi:hypothetical protein